METSRETTVLFRTLQAIHDLRAVARLAPHGTRARIAAGADSPDAEADLGRLIGPEGCRITSPSADRLYQGLVLAAALPDDDFDAFQTATAILLADRLQRGCGSDDLFWHWDAFHHYYALCRAPIRAVLMQGFRRAQEEGLVNLQDPPEGAALLSESRETIDKALSETDAEQANPIRDALDGAPLDEGFWRRHCLPFLDPATRPPARLLRAIRHLYESRPDWSPHGDHRFDPASAVTRVLPVILS